MGWYRLQRALAGFSGCARIEATNKSSEMNPNKRIETFLSPICDKEGKIKLSKVKHLMKSVGFRISGDAKWGYELEIGEGQKVELEEPIDWSRAYVDKTYKMPKKVITRGSTIRKYRVTKDQLIAAAKKYLFTTERGLRVDCVDISVV